MESKKRKTSENTKKSKDAKYTVYSVQTSYKELTTISDQFKLSNDEQLNLWMKNINNRQ